MTITLDDVRHHTALLRFPRTNETMTAMASRARLEADFGDIVGTVRAGVERPGVRGI